MPAETHGAGGATRFLVINAGRGDPIGSMRFVIGLRVSLARRLYESPRRPCE